jgi:type VI secretion system protein ImpF
VLDRLTAGGGHERPFADQRVGVRELRRSVLRNLEWLLNTRSLAMDPGDDLLAGCELARTSVLGFGIPDLTRYSRSREADAAEIAALLRGAIVSFEPRLRADTVRVEPLGGPATDTGALRFRIAATLQVHPIREAVAFDTEVRDNGEIDLREIT